MACKDTITWNSLRARAMVKVLCAVVRSIYQLLMISFVFDLDVR